jgi:hypothetical protein
VGCLPPLCPTFSRQQEETVAKRNWSVAPSVAKLLFLGRERGNYKYKKDTDSMQNNGKKDSHQGYSSLILKNTDCILLMFLFY